MPALKIALLSGGNNSGLVFFFEWKNPYTSKKYKNIAVSYTHSVYSMNKVLYSIQSATVTF
jgi:hypothetical protein